MISLGMITTQVALTFALIIGIREAGYPELYQAAGPAIALTIALAIGSLLKSRLAAHLLGAPVSVWRWPLLFAAAAAVAVGEVAILLPEWAELAFGIAAMLLAYGAVIWRWGFTDADRILFRKTG
jgi:hypothetical protein